MKFQLKRSEPRGFALVVTLSLMILLTVIAVGMLTLATVTLRTTGQENAMAVARGNARLALMLALGELQKTTGPDRAITAPASIVDAKNPLGVTGVWKPWDVGSKAESRTRGARNDNFKQWLVSTVDGKAPETRTGLPLVPIGSKDSVTLLGNPSLGDRATEKGDDQRINVATTQLVRGKTVSRYAWAVIDEGTKVRANLYETDLTSKGAAAMRVGAPPVDGVAALKGLDQLDPTESEAKRMVSMKTAGLLLGDSKDKLKVYSPDLTVDSLSLMTDVVSGGLKKDLSLWFARGLSAAEKTATLYQESRALDTGYPADPPLSLLETYHQYYKKIGQREGAVSPVPGGVVAKLPSRYAASRSDIATPNVPSEPLMVPTVIRVDIIFSMITRDVHSGRAAKLIAAGRPYMMHLLYLPVVTIHNPYNVPLSLEGMKVTFKNIPIAFQFLVDDQPLTSDLVPLNQMYTGSQNNPNQTKDFSCSLGSAINSTRPIVLQAGQTKLFGTPKVAPTWSWNDEKPGYGEDGTALFDHKNNQTSDFQLAPTLMTPATIGGGFDCDWLAPTGLQTAQGKICGSGEGIVSLKGTERVGVRYAPFAPAAGKGSFNVKVELKQSGRFVEAGAFSLKYGSSSRLKSIVEEGTSLRFPTARSFPETFPKTRFDPPITVRDLYETNGSVLRDYTNPKPFVIFSVGSRTTKESFIPTRTIADANPVMNLANIDLTSGKDPVGGVPLEMVMMPIRGGNAAIEGDRATQEGYGFGGSGDLNGTPRATFYELAGAPLESLAQFRNANLAGSGFMPMTTYTVGESRAHPQIGTDGIQSSWTNGSVMLDHTWLSNEAMWDRYFLSTIADQTTTRFDSDKPYSDVMNDFFKLAKRLPNQRFQPYGADSSGTPEVVKSSNNPQDIIAASLMLRGGFNVNSTSEDAWIAVLSGLRGKAIETLAGIEEGSEKFTPFPRERVPTGKSIDGQMLNDGVTVWEGYRSLSDENIASLAKEITTEVRNRGPFLSVADFVNRGIGSEGDETNVKGAIQAAIDHLPDLNRVADLEGIDLAAAELSGNGYKSMQAGIGNSATNAPGSLTQGDLLTGLGSRITVRSDTFRIRSYGEARDSSGKVVLARAWCEAIVQRVPDHVDPADAATVRQVPVTGGAGGSVNQIFGRAYEVVSFKWLSPSEV